MAEKTKVEKKEVAPDTSATPTSTDTNKVPTGKPIFNPLKDAVDEKSYAGAGATPNVNPNIHIPEYVYQAPPEEVVNDIPVDNVSEAAAEKKEKEKPKAANPDMQNASEKEKHDGAAAMTDILLNTWEQLYKAGNQMMKISERQVNKLQQAGQLDMRVSVPYKMGDAPMSTVFQDLNNDADNVLVLEKEFQEEIHPLITEELAKAGHGMSNKQKLIFLISTKVVSDGMKVSQFIALKKDYLKFAREQTILSRRGAKKPAPIVEDEISDSVSHEEVIIEENRSTTLQEEALARLGPKGGVNNTANFGNKNKLRGLDKEVKKNTGKSSVKKSAKSRIAEAKRSVAIDPDPAPTGKRKGPGRPKGAKNKSKKR